MFNHKRKRDEIKNLKSCQEKENAELENEISEILEEDEPNKAKRGKIPKVMMKKPEWL